MNSLPKQPAIKAWLDEATTLLKASGVLSARLDAEIILAHTIRRTRTYLHAHDDELLDLYYKEIANARLELRRERTPIAYIIGHKEFYGRRFRTTPQTLIPRPESEAIISLLLQHATSTMKHLVDVGTGTGCLGITAKLERPDLEVSLIDTSRGALQVAKKNAEAYHVSVRILRSNLLSQYPIVADIIIANLPYVDTSWTRSPETDHEPSEALFAKDGGLRLIFDLIDQTRTSLQSRGLTFIEADPRQHDAIITHAKKHQLTLLEVRGFIIALQKD